MLGYQWRCPDPLVGGVDPRRQFGLGPDLPRQRRRSRAPPNELLVNEGRKASAVSAKRKALMPERLSIDLHLVGRS